MVRSWVRAHALAAALLALGGIAAIGFGVYWFAPQRLVLDQRVDEARPSALPGSSSSRRPGEAEGAEAEALGGQLTLASGRFRSLEHGTSGRAELIELADGRRFLRLDDLDTSNGPDLRVYLTDQPLSDDWHVWDDGEVVDLGSLKGNVGSSNYLIPVGVDLPRFQTAVVWCRRFTVGFGVAPLDPES
jgi:hypothetical protein